MKLFIPLAIIAASRNKFFLGAKVRCRPLLNEVSGSRCAYYGASTGAFQ